MTLPWPEGEMLLPPPVMEPTAPWRVGPAEWDFRAPLVVGVLNVTPDSFSDGGRYLDPEKALARALEIEQEGAHVLDLGGASSHPNAPAVSARDEWARVAPVLERLAGRLGIPVSIDTQSPEVAEAALAAGAHLINDVSGLVSPEMARVAARHDVPLVIMHNGWALPARRPGAAFLPALLEFLRERIALAESHGARRVILDPGYGFGKSLEENLTLVRSLNALRPLRRPVLICTSRKGSLGRLVSEPEPRERLGAALSTSLFAAFQGANLIRVHDVKPFRQALQAWMAVKAAPREGGE